MSKQYSTIPPLVELLKELHKLLCLKNNHPGQKKVNCFFEREISCCQGFWQGFSMHTLCNYVLYLQLMHTLCNYVLYLQLMYCICSLCVYYVLYFQLMWVELRHTVRCIYRKAGTELAIDHMLDVEKMKALVHK